MSERIMTLFGEEIIPEQLKAVGKSRAKKKTDGQEAEEEPAEEAKEDTNKVNTLHALCKKLFNRIR